MNSQQLQKNFSITYQHFFSHHDMVISLPRTLLLCGKSNKFTGTGNSLSTKIPQRIYLWAKFTNKTNETIHYLYPQQKQKTFANSELQSFYNIDSQLLKELDIDFEVNILAEHTFFEAEYIITLLFLAKEIRNKKIKTTDLEELLPNTYQTTKIQKIINDSFQKYKTSLLFVSKQNPQLHNIMTSIIHCQNPILHETKNIRNEIKLEKKRNKYFNYYLVNQHLPFDLYSIENPLIRKEIQNKNKDKLLKNMLEKVERYFSYKIWEDIKNTKQIGKENNFFETIKSYDNIINTLINDKKITIINHENWKKIITENLNFTSQENDIQIQTDQNMHIFSKTHLKITQKEIQNINDQKRTKFSLDYASDKDGIEATWLKIHQRKQQNKYSPLCSEYEMKVIKNKKFINQPIEYYQAIQKKDGILFDAIQNKIFILWEKLWSKEIHSQTGTVELFRTILQDRDNEINNKELPISCYSKNKNEMVGKIILPLCKIVEQKIWKKLKLNCYWSLWDFFIKLNYSDIPMYYVQRRM